MADEELITHARLLELLCYDPDTGLFMWRVDRGRVKAGDRAGSVDKHGYNWLMVEGRNYFFGRLARFYVTGEWPKAMVDHKNCVRADDRWENLRDATCQQNNANMSMPSHNTSGIKGVSWHKQIGKWRACISVNDKYVHLGLFERKEDAAEAYKAAAARYFGEFAKAAHA
jgi:AP2 domain/HNH endonuclease